MRNCVGASGRGGGVGRDVQRCGGDLTDLLVLTRDSLAQAVRERRSACGLNGALTVGGPMP